MTERLSDHDAEDEPVLPDQSSDDLVDAADRLAADRDDDERLRREVPPHHGD